MIKMSLVFLLTLPTYPSPFPLSLALNRLSLPRSPSLPIPLFWPYAPTLLHTPLLVTCPSLYLSLVPILASPHLILSSLFLPPYPSFYASSFPSHTFLISLLSSQYPSIFSVSSLFSLLFPFPSSFPIPLLFSHASLPSPYSSTSLIPLFRQHAFSLSQCPPPPPAHALPPCPCLFHAMWIFAVYVRTLSECLPSSTSSISGIIYIFTFTLALGFTAGQQ